MFSENNQS